MAHLAFNQFVKHVGSDIAGLQVPIASGAKLYQGAMVCLLTASGYAVRAGTASTGAVVGVAQAVSAAPTSDGAANVNLLTGTFLFPLDESNPPGIADVGKIVYASDDNHISTSNSGPKAGIL